MADNDPSSQRDDAKPQGYADAPSRGKSGRIHRRLAVNSISNVFRHIVFLAVAFFLTPFVVRTLGDSAYGLWIVLLSFVGYAGILELGVQPAVVKLVGQHRGSGDLQKLEGLLSAALYFFLIIGLLVALFLAFAVPQLAPVLVKEFQGLDGLRPFFFLIAADALIMFLSYLFAGILFGAQLYHAKNLIDLTALLLYSAVLVIFLPSGGLVLLAAAKVGMDLLVLLATAVVGRVVLPEIHFDLRRVSRDSFRELLAFGGKVFVVSITTRASTHTLPLIISSHLNAAATAFFAIPIRLVDYSRQISWALTMGFMPMFSELGGKQDHALIRSLYLRYSRYLLLLNLPVLALTFVHGREFIALWIGPEYAEQGGQALHLLVAAALARGFQPLLWRLFIGLGQLDLMVAVSASASILNIVLAFVFVDTMGITGVALSVLVTTIPAQAIFIWHASRYLKVSVGDLLYQIHLRPVLVGALFYVAAASIARILGQDSYGVMAAGVFLSAALYVPLALISLHDSERLDVLNRVRAKFSRLKRS